TLAECAKRRLAIVEWRYLLGVVSVKLLGRLEYVPGLGAAAAPRGKLVIQTGDDRIQAQPLLLAGVGERQGTASSRQLADGFAHVTEAYLAGFLNRLAGHGHNWAGLGAGPSDATQHALCGRAEAHGDFFWQAQHFVPE